MRDSSCCVVSLMLASSVGPGKVTPRVSEAARRAAHQDRRPVAAFPGKEGGAGIRNRSRNDEEKEQMSRRGAAWRRWLAGPSAGRRPTRLSLQPLEEREVPAVAPAPANPEA